MICTRRYDDVHRWYCKILNRCIVYMWHFSSWLSIWKV